MTQSRILCRFKPRLTFLSNFSQFYNNSDKRQSLHRSKRNVMHELVPTMTHEAERKLMCSLPCQMKPNLIKIEFLQWFIAQSLNVEIEQIAVLNSILIFDGIEYLDLGKCSGNCIK